MKRGLDYVVSCPCCEGLATHMTLISGNNLWAQAWSDGKQAAPMCPRPPEVVKCRYCRECFWLADAKLAGFVDPDKDGDASSSVDPAFAGAQRVKQPTEEEYYEAIREGFAADSEQERRLRILAWWRRNDAFRGGLWALEGSVASDSGAWRSNLQALLGLLDEEDDNHQLMKAEVLRELGEFGRAVEVLGRVTSAEFTTVIDQIRSLCEAEDTKVRVLRFGD